MQKCSFILTDYPLHQFSLKYDWYDIKYLRVFMSCRLFLIRKGEMAKYKRIINSKFCLKFDFKQNIVTNETTPLIRITIRGVESYVAFFWK